ncbi:MAG TPA: EAL domain-containing protein [Vicinamibacteria bacterium]|nr:EAL domain-containing protein [Vicinamibacteria bacterium]
MGDDAGVGQELRGVIETLRRRDQQYRLLAEQAADGVLLVGADGRIADASPGASVLLARPRGQLVKLPLADLVEADKAVDNVSALLSLRERQRLTRSYRLRRLKGPPLEVEISARRLADGRLQLALRDIAERRRAADALRESEERYERLAASAADAIVIEASGRVVLANPSLRRLLGLQPSAPVAGRALGDFVHPDERPEVARAAAGAASAGPAGVRLVTRLRRADGSTAEVEGAATVVTYRGRPAVQFLMREVRDERPAAQGDVYRDSLTGLTSALIAPDRLSVAIAQAYRHRARVGLVHVDLDDFGATDAKLGRPLADRLLRAVARRLLHCVRQGDTAARLEQDAFALVLPGLHHAEDATRIAEKVLRALRKPFPLSEGATSLTASVGIAVFPEDGEDAPALLASGERSAARAHAAGGDRIESSAPPPPDESWDAVELEAGLRAALGGGSMSLNGTPPAAGALHYQPIFAVGGKILGVEALLRWQHPQLGLVFPQHFLSKADFTGLILAIGPWILRTAACEVREWQRDHRGLRLAVNLSPPELMKRTLPDEVKAALEETGFPKQLLQLEVPEGHVVSDLPRSLDMLHRLKALGVSLVLDRFAVRYSSLGRLAELPLDGVKLDLAFLRGPSSNPEDVSLLTAVTAVARGLKLRVCAQGVENAAQLQLLEQLGCSEFQGFHLGPPVPPGTLADQLSPRGKRLTESRR